MLRFITYYLLAAVAVLVFLQPLSARAEYRGNANNWVTEAQLTNICTDNWPNATYYFTRESLYPTDFQLQVIDGQSWRLVSQKWYACHLPSGSNSGELGYVYYLVSAVDCAKKMGQVVSTGKYDAGRWIDNVNSSGLIIPNPNDNSVPIGIHSPACSGSCQVAFLNPASGYNAYVTPLIVNGVKHMYVQGSYVYLAQQCSSGGTPNTATSTTPNESCGANQTIGQINGKTICIDKLSGNQVNTETQNPTTPHSTTTTTNSTTVTNNDNSVTVTNTTTVVNQDGSTTKNVEACTTPAGGGAKSCTTTSSTTGTNGTSQGYSNKGNTDQAKFCDDNPNSPMCKEHSFTATGCGTPPPCDGDAIMCGIAAEQFKRNCQMFDDANKDPNTQWAKDHAIQQEPAFGSAWGDSKEEKDVGNLVNFSSYQAGSTCPFSPHTYTIPGFWRIPAVSFQMDLSAGCDWGGAISTIILIVSAISCGALLARSFSGG